jgi:hypothetical protein
MLNIKKRVMFEQCPPGERGGGGGDFLRVNQQEYEPLKYDMKVDFCPDWAVENSEIYYAYRKSRKRFTMCTVSLETKIDYGNCLSIIPQSQ